MRGKRCMATSTEGRLKGTFQGHGARGRCIQHSRKFRGIVKATLHANRPLPYRWNHLLKSQRHKLNSRPSADPEALESSGRKNSPVGDVLFANLAEPRIHIASDLGEDDAREESRHLQTPPRAASRNRQGDLHAAAQN